MKIHKQSVPLGMEVGIPGTPVYFSMQAGFLDPMVWFLVDGKFTVVTVSGTGHEFNGHHLFSTLDGPYVWHLIKVAP